MKFTQPTDKGFTDALAQFKAAEQHAEMLSGKLDTAKARLLRARMDNAGVQREIDAFGSDLDATPESAAKLTTRKSEQDAMCSLLEQSIDHIEQKVAESKAAILRAEANCTKIQRAYFDKALDQMCDEFLRENAGALQKLTQAMYADSLFASLQGPTGIASARSFATRHVEALFANVFPLAIARVFDGDEQFREGCIPPANQTLAQPVCSALVSSAERAAAGLVGHRSEQEIAAALLPREPEPVEVLDLNFAMAAARQAALAAESNRQHAQIYRERLVVHPSDKGMIGGVEEHEREAKRFDEIVATWDERIRAHQAAQQ